MSILSRRRPLRKEIALAGRLLIILSMLLFIPPALAAFDPRPDISPPEPTVIVQSSPTSSPTPSPIAVTPEPDYFELSGQERKLIAIQIAVEAEGAPIETKRLVAQCILDRTETNICSDGTVYGTLTWPGQFDYRGNYNISEDVYLAIDWVFTEGNRVTSDRVIFFCNQDRVSRKTLKWFKSFEQIIESGNMTFFSGTKLHK